jgi:hypothetical protein
VHGTPFYFVLAYHARIGIFQPLAKRPKLN